MNQLEFCKQVSRANGKEQVSDNNHILCFFSGIKEQTPQTEEDLPFGAPDERAPPKKTMRCYFDDCRLKVVAKGGSEFVNNVRHKIIEIYPLDDGILIRAIFNADLYAFELGGGVTNLGQARTIIKPSISSTSSHSRETYVYLSLLEHPLNDARPLAYEQADIQMINTCMELVYISPAIPFAVLHDPTCNEARFCLMKSCETELEVDKGADVAMHSVDQDSRVVRQQLPSLIGTSNLMLQSVHTVEKCHRPASVIVTQGLTQHEMTVCLFIQELKQVYVYTCNLKKIDRSFKKTIVYQNVSQMVQLEFSRPLLQYGLKLAPKQMVSGLMQQSLSQNGKESSKMRVLKERLSATANDLVLLSADNQFITVYAGGSTLIHQVNLHELLRSTPKTSIIQNVSWTTEAPSTLQVTLQQGVIVSVEMALAKDGAFLISSILRVLKQILPEDMFANYFQETVDLLVNKSKRQDTFESFSDMLLAKISVNATATRDDKDYLFFLTPKKEEVKAQEKSGGKILRMPSASSKIKPVTKDTEKKVPTMSMPTSAIKTSPSKYQAVVKQQTSSKLQVKKIQKPEGSPVSSKQEFSKAALIPNAFELMLKSDFCQNDTLFKHMLSEFSPLQTLQEKHKSQPVRNNFMRPQSTQSPKKEAEKKKTLMVKDYAQQIFRVLHLMHEDLKLQKLLFGTEAPKLRKLLFIFALHLHQELNLTAYMAYYVTEDPSLPRHFEEELKHRVEANGPIEHVPRITSWLQEMLAGVPGTKFPVIFSTTRIVCRLYEIMTQQHQSYFLQLKQAGDQWSENHAQLMIKGKPQMPKLTVSSVKDYLMLDGSIFGSLHLFEKVLYCLKEERFALDQIQQLPEVVSLPIIEIIRYTRVFQQEVQTVQVWPSSLYRLIRREDIINNLKMFDKGTNQISKLQMPADEPKLKRQGSKNFALSRRDSDVFNEQQDATKVDKIQNQYIQDLIGEEKAQDQAPSTKLDAKESVITEFLKNKFGKDTCYQEAEHLLSSSVDMVLKVDHILQGGMADQIALNEEERQRRQKLQLDKLFARHLSKCVGRGALTLGTQETLPTETLQIPKISQQGFVLNPNEQGEAQYGQTVSVTLEAREQRELMQWPSFHNGVATALKLSQLGFKRTQTSDSAYASNLTYARDWIMFHKPQEPKNEHGGFLLGIGLLGQLDSLKPTDLYQHLKSAHDSTTIGILLGRAVSQIGKMDDADSRTMCLHIPSLLPQNLSVEISLPVQSAAVIGAGLLYQQTQNRLITEMLLSQIGRKPTSDKMMDREGYALASGIALGLVNLAKNKDFVPRPKITNHSTEKEMAQNPFNQGAVFNELIDLKLDERLIRFIEGGKKMPLPRSMLQTHQNTDPNKSSAIKENEMVNVYVTSSGALFALTLIYLKSNNKTIADRLQVPDSFFAMEFVRPIALLQKILCRNLIMWDSITLSEEWIFSNIPPIIRQIYESDMETIDKQFTKRCSTKEIDFATVALCYVNILAGATFSIGFKYAGTGNVQAKQVIEDQISFFRKQLKVVTGTQPLGGPIQTNTNSQTKNQVDRSTVETCLCVLALSLGMVMAGKCDVGCFRVLRVLRKRFEGDMHYGYNLAINMAIGFLFLGSGAYTFSRSNEAIAALLCATYPIFPSSPGDNRFHLQALRHFYVLAIETRLLQAKDIDTGNFVNIEVLVTLEDDASQEVKHVVHQTPDIINGKILQLQVKDHCEYHDLTLQIAESKHEESLMQVDQLSKDLFKNGQSRFEQSALQRVIYVKRKNLAEKQSSEKLKSELATAIHQKDQFDEAAAICMHKQASNAFQSLKKIKDRSIEMFIKNFASTLFTKEFRVKPATDLCLDEVMNAIQDVMMSTTDLSHETFSLYRQITSELEPQLYETVAVETYQRHNLTLLALNECLTNDKVSSLPLLLNLSTCPASIETIQSLDSYSKFMMNCRKKGYFSRTSHEIIQRPLLETLSHPKFVQDPKLVKYVSTLGSSIISDCTGQLKDFSKLLDPCKLQVIAVFVSQVIQQASEVYDHHTIETYLMQAKSKIDISGDLHELVKEALKQALESMGIQVDVEIVNKVILPGIIAAI